jgi:hypothetical protein
LGRLLASAEAYGYGPATKLRVIAARLTERGHRVDFVGEGTAAEYTAGESASFASVISLGSMAEISEIAGHGYDGVLSVMDPHLVMWSFLKGLPSVYVDSLYWFWAWDDGIQAQRDWEVVTSARDVVEAVSLIASLPMSSAQYVAHRASSTSCAQRTWATSQRVADHPELGRVRVVDAIVDLSRYRTMPRTEVLACMSGLMNPLVSTQDVGPWLAAATQLVDEAMTCAGHPDTPVLLTGNHQVIASYADNLPPRFRHRPRSHTEVLDLLGSARVCLTPPGLTTMLEAIAYGAPIVLLPEQHYGHAKIFDEFRGRDPGVFPHGLMSPYSPGREKDAKAETHRLINDLSRRAVLRDDVWSALVTGVADGVRAATSDGEACSAAQYAAVSDFTGDFHGAEDVVDEVESIVARA